MSIEFPLELSEDAYDYGSRSDGGTHGLVLTKPHIVELILDLSGYDQRINLTGKRLLEPSCGHGAFLIPGIARLLASAKLFGVDPRALTDAIRAFDIDDEHVAATRAAVVAELKTHGVNANTAMSLANAWVRQADFLLTAIAGNFDYVVGNPPYIRIEQLSPEIQSEYRRRYATLFDRADLYVAFIERSLRLLAPLGALAFICADRWVLNKYGAPLRELISRDYAVRTYVDMHQTSPFESEVIAYPSVFVIARQARGEPVRVVRLAKADPVECEVVRDLHHGRSVTNKNVSVDLYATWFIGGEPWILSSPSQLATLRDLEARFPSLEESGKTSVRIGIATGNDSVYVVTADADIEPDRLIPLVMRSDIENGKVKDGRRYVIDTYAPMGTINLESYPRLERYLEANAVAVRGRHVAKGSATGWFRTIDRPYPELVRRPKLLIPDIAGSNEVVYEAGHFYPHHNLYFIISEEWDLEVLGGLLASRVALFFVWSYAVKMRGGYLRFQAQYLRRIRVPKRETITPVMQNRVKAAFRNRDFFALDELAREIYGLPSLPDFDFVDTRR